jgi:hypothetical protein
MDLYFGRRGNLNKTSAYEPVAISESVATWQAETAAYTSRLEEVFKRVSPPPPRPVEVRYGPLETQPTPLQVIIRRSVTLYEVGLWLRTRETLQGLICLLREGYLSPAAALVRLLFELWGAGHCQSQAIDRFGADRDLVRFASAINRLLEGVREETMRPRDTPAFKKPMHVREIVRGLADILPRAESVYADLCESAHANQPRFLEWWFIGRLGDNWTNETVKARGHELLERTVSIAECAVEGVAGEVSHGLRACGDLYDVAA